MAQKVIKLHARKNLFNQKNILLESSFVVSKGLFRVAFKKQTSNSKLRLNLCKHKAEATQSCYYIIISHNKQRWNNYQSEIVSILISLTYWTQFGISLGIIDENDTMTPLEIPFLPIPAFRIGLTKHVSYSKVFPTYKINSCPKTLLLE